MLNPQREDGRVLNGHKGAAQGQIVNVTCVKTGEEIPTRLNISERQRDILLAGGLLNSTKESN